MPPRKFTLKTTVQHQNQRLDDVLVQWLSNALKQPLSKGKARKLVIAGAVYLNGKRVRIASKSILGGAEICVYIDLAKLTADRTSNDRPFEMTPERILFEDNYLIIVDKPPGLPTQPTVDEARDNLYGAVKRYLGRRAQLPPEKVYLGLHHRLDRDTSGVLLMTKSPEANPGVAALFNTHSISKVYLALSLGVGRKEPPPSEWTVKNYLGRSKELGRSKNTGRMCSVRSGGDFAHTEFKLLEQCQAASLPIYLVEAHPMTGRTHQIRVHLSEDHLPILGDSTYSSNVNRSSLVISRLMLHAATLTFVHPILQNKISIQSILPGDFRQCLERIKMNFRMRVES